MDWGPTLPQRCAAGIALGMVIITLGWQASQLSQQPWAGVVAVMVITAVAVSLPVARRLTPQPGVVLGAIAASAVAVYGCVPETSDQMPTVAVILGILLMIEIVGRRLLPLSVHFGGAALVLWAGIYGATGRESALIGALFAFWPVVIAPLTGLLRPRLDLVIPFARWAVMAVGAAAAVVVARTGALQPTGRPAIFAVVIWGPLSLATALVVAMIAPKSPPATHP